MVRVNTEQVFSAYILSKIGRGEEIIDSDEAALAIPILHNRGDIEMRGLTSRSTALGEYSPEFRARLASLVNCGYASSNSERSAIILPRGILDAAEVMVSFRRENGELPVRVLQDTYHILFNQD